MLPTDFDHHATSRLPLPAGTITGLVVAIVAILLVALVSYESLRARSEAVDNLQDTLEVLRQIEVLVSTVKDAETGQRSYLLTGLDRNLDLYNRSRSTATTQAARLVERLAANAEQQARARSLSELITNRLDFAAETLGRHQSGDSTGAVELVRSGRGLAVMDQIRALADEMTTAERVLLQTRQAAFDRAAMVSQIITWSGSALLILLTAVAAIVMSRDFRARQAEAWLRTGQVGLSEKLQGEQRLDRLGDHLVSYLARYLDAPVGAVYLVEPGGGLAQVAGYALPAGDSAPKRLGEGLAGQAAKENRLLHVTNVPNEYLPVSSTLGSRAPAQLLVAPAAAEGVVHAVIEFGFFRPVSSDELELLSRTSEMLAIAIRSSRDRTRLEELLEETQRQSEELQAQQEELRVSNEELEEQSRALKESQVRLEGQQAELELINANLEEQTHLLEAQKADLSRSQATVTEKAAELQRANQYKSEFLANMSHELRTPLNSALILATLLADNKDGNLTDEQVTFARTIYDAGNDLLALINDVLDLSKIESGKVDLSIEPVAIATTIDSLAKTFEPLAQTKGLTFTASVTRDVPPRIESDAQRLGQVLKNLLSNAVKFTDQGSVTLDVSMSGSGVIRFVVGDTGIGIPDHQQLVIFEAFRQADGSTHRKYGGTGLGLSISRDLAHLLGGDIAVNSEAGRGSTFTLTLPVTYTGRHEGPVRRPAEQTRDAMAAVPTRPAPAPAATTLPARPAIDDDRDALASASRRLLIVEDDPRFAGILRDLAREKGFQAVVTHTAQDASAAATVYAPHAILLDINLPDHSGLTVLDQLKRNPITRHLPVHIISVADHAHRALERGAVGYALKPVQRDELIKAFQKLEARLSQGMRRVLVVEDDERQRASISQLLSADNVEIVGAATAAEALEHLQRTTFDCVVLDLKLPDLSGGELLERMATREDVSFPPVIVYTGRSLTADEEQQLRRFSKSIIIKDARSPERLLDEVTLFLHQVEATLPIERQRMLKAARDRDTALEHRRILVVDDDARNIFALSKVLEPRGAKVEIARNGREALDALQRAESVGDGRVDLVLMDVMMPEMDGLTAMAEIRRNPAWRSLPIIALTAKAMQDDQEKSRAAGANDYIAKPFDIEKLLSLIRVWMPR